MNFLLTETLDKLQVLISDFLFPCDSAWVINHTGEQRGEGKDGEEGYEAEEGRQRKEAQDQGEEHPV